MEAITPPLVQLRLLLIIMLVYILEAVGAGVRVIVVIDERENYWRNTPAEWWSLQQRQGRG